MPVSSITARLGAMGRRSCDADCAPLGTWPQRSDENPINSTDCSNAHIENTGAQKCGIEGCKLGCSGPIKQFNHSNCFFSLRAQPLSFDA